VCGGCARCVPSAGATPRGAPVPQARGSRSSTRDARRRSAR
jgi:hypothetical protein